MATHLVWFRADLRMHDNLALAAARRDPHARVLGCLSPRQGNGASTVWRRARRHLSLAIFTACKRRWRKGDPAAR